jgi:transketolase
MIGVASGLAVGGKKVFVSSFAMFATGRCWEQIRNMVAHDSLNVKIVATHGGITVGEDGATHQAIEDVAIMRAIAPMRVIVPADAVETEAVIRYVAETNGPFYVRLSRSATPLFFEPGTVDFEIGKFKRILEGDDVAIFANGIMVNEAHQAAMALKEEGISVRLVNASSVSIIDHDEVRDASQNIGRIITAEEHSVLGGLGSAIAETLAEIAPCKMRMIGVRDKFGESGKPDELMKRFHLTADDIVKAVKDILKD